MGDDLNEVIKSFDVGAPMGLTPKRRSRYGIRVNEPRPRRHVF